MNGVLPAWVVEMIVITYRGLKNGSGQQPVAHLPPPFTYVGTFVIFGGLAMFTGRAAKPAAIMAWGVVLATVLNLWSPSGAINSALQSSTPKPSTQPLQPNGPLGPVGPTPPKGG